MSREFVKYKERADIHWKEAFSRSIFKHNAHLWARYKIALDFLGEVGDKTVLDIGSGDCALTSLVAKQGAKVIAIDSSPEGLDFGKEHFKKLGLEAEFLLADACNVPLGDESADAVISAELIEHLPEPKKHIKEISRLLRPGGYLVLSTPYRLSEIPSDPYHIHEFYPSELKSLLEEDFVDIQIKESHHIFWYSLYSFGRLPIIRRPLFKYLVNFISLWFGKNPFLKDDSQRKKRDYYTQITCRAVKR